MVYNILIMLALTLFQPLVLFNSDNKKQRGQWRVVDDGVMGGLSEGRVKINPDGILEYWGTVS